MNPETIAELLTLDTPKRKRAQPKPPTETPKYTDEQLKNSLYPMPNVHNIAGCCGVLAIGPFHYHGAYGSSVRNIFNLTFGQTYVPEQVDYILRIKIKEYKRKAKLLTVIFNEHQNKRLRDTVLKLGFTEVSTMSDVRNPNTSLLLYTYVYDLNPS